ncbi:hypothetical protein KGQ64_15310 [bacterium]|nr:hypothetical protein [bacterium]
MSSDRVSSTGLLAAVLLLVSACVATGVPAEPTGTPTPGWSRVIVMLRVNTTDPASLAALREKLLSGLPPGSHRVLRTYSAVPAVSLDVSPGALAALRSSPLVASVQADSLAHPTTDR